MFKDREHAASLLTALLAGRDFENPLVLGVPRGGVVIADTLARELGAELDVVLARKLRDPAHPELAIGAISEDGRVYLNDHAQDVIDFMEDYPQEEARTRFGELTRQRDLYRGARECAEVTGRSVIVADDGIATGSTMVAALQAIRDRKPAELIVAVPVASGQSLKEVRDYCDEVLCLSSPESFTSVSRFYKDFSAVEDEEVLQLLELSHTSEVY